MSLLMQALRKAERAKHSHAPGDEPVKPSDSFDGLTLEPEPLSLSPLDAPPPDTPAPPDPAPPRAPRTTAPPPMRKTPVRAPAIGMPDPRIIRIAVLCTIALLIAALFGYLYWRAMYGPGSSKHLPMVPMPGQGGLAVATAPAPEQQYLPPPPQAQAPAPTSVYPPPTQAPAVPAYPAPQVQSPIPTPVAPTAPANAAAPAAPASAAAPAAPAKAAASPARALAARAPAPVPSAPAPAQVEVPVVAYAQPISAPSAPPPGYIENLTPEDYARMDRAQQQPPAPPATAVAPAPVAAAPEQSAAMAQAPARRAERAAAGDAGDIRVARASAPPRISPSLQSGYAAFRGGDFATARQHYQSALQQEPNNRDALLGLAAIAIQERQGQQAADLYARLLAIDPNDNDALAGLSGLRQAEPGQAESRLRRVLERNPEAASALFALGNLYARQGRWAEAQQQYFRAYTSTPDNPDYAFNLAVGLDRLNQSKLALNYYQRALTLAGTGTVNFDRNAAANRVRELGGQ